MSAQHRVKGLDEATGETSLSDLRALRNRVWVRLKDIARAKNQDSFSAEKAHLEKKKKELSGWIDSLVADGVQKSMDDNVSDMRLVKSIADRVVNRSKKTSADVAEALAQASPEIVNKGVLGMGIQGAVAPPPGSRVAPPGGLTAPKTADMGGGRWAAGGLPSTLLKPPVYGGFQGAGQGRSGPDRKLGRGRVPGGGIRGISGSSTDRG